MNTRSIRMFVTIAYVGLTCAVGCGTLRTSDTSRTATEQLLVAAAVQQAVAQLDFEFLEERKVFVDDSLIDRVDKTFVVAEVRAFARRSGVNLVAKREDAHYVLELRVGAVGTDRNDYIFGIPASQVPTVGGLVGTPEVPAYKSITQTGACSVGFVAYRQDDGTFFCSSGPTYGFSDHMSRWIMGAGPGMRDNIAPPRSPENTAAVSQQPATPGEKAPKPE